MDRLPCACGHDKGDHRRRMDECEAAGCPCPLWRPPFDEKRGEDG